MKKSEVFIVTGWAECQGIDMTLTVRYPGGEKRIKIDTDGRNDADDMIIIANKNNGGQLFLGTAGDPGSFILEIDTLVGTVASHFLGWAVVDAQAAFKGEFATEKLTADTIVFTSNGDGFDVSMDTKNISDISDTIQSAQTETSDTLTDDDIAGNIKADQEILSYYGDTASAEEARALLQGNMVDEAEAKTADMIRTSFSDMIKYRTEI